MRKYISSISFLSLFFISNPAIAATTCIGTISSSHVTIDGGVLFRASWGGYIQACNISATWKGVPPEVCAAWVAKLDAAVSLGRSTRVYYTDTLVCADVPTYSASPAPYYIMLE